MAVKKYNLPPISPCEQERMIEVNFTLFVRHLLKMYNKSILSLDIIEAIAVVSGCNVTYIKQLAQAVYNDFSAVVPTRQEQVVLLYRSNYTVRKIQEMTGVHMQTMYRYLDDYVAEGMFEYEYRLEETQLDMVRKFMDSVDRITSWR